MIVGLIETCSFNVFAQQIHSIGHLLCRYIKIYKMLDACYIKIISGLYEETRSV